MLPRKHRLTSSGDIRAVIKGGFSVRTPSAIAHISVKPRGEGGSETRFCFIAGKRIGNAVKRNFSKRRFREVAGVLLTEIPDEVAVDIVWRLQPTSSTANVAALRKDVARVSQKVRSQINKVLEND